MMVMMKKMTMTWMVMVGGRIESQWLIVSLMCSFRRSSLKVVGYFRLFFKLPPCKIIFVNYKVMYYREHLTAGILSFAVKIFISRDVDFKKLKLP